MHNELRKVIQEFKEKGVNFALCLPYLKCGDAPNVIANDCIMKGSLRSFGDEDTYKIKLSVEKGI